MPDYPARENAMPRRRSQAAIGILLLTITTFGLATLPIGAQQSTGPTGTQGRKVALVDQLRVGLKVKTKADKVFVNAVVLAVQQGKLPRRLVDSTFLWARNRSKQRSGKRQLRPMIYFQPALTLRAKRLGLIL